MFKRNSYYIFLLITFFGCLRIKPTLTEDPSQITRLQNLDKSLGKIQNVNLNTLKEHLSRISDKFLHFDEWQNSNNVDRETETECRKDWDRILFYSQSNAFNKFWDSFAVPGTGLLEGNFLYLGQPEECVNVKKGYFAVQEKPFLSFPETKPFLMQVLYPVEGFKLSFRLGICMPSSCTTDDVTEIYAPLFHDTNVTISTTTRYEFEPTVAFGIAAFVYSTLIVLVLAGTSLGGFRRLKGVYKESLLRDLASTGIDDNEEELEMKGAESAKGERRPLVNREDKPRERKPRDNVAIRALLCFDFYTNFTKILQMPSQQDGSSRQLTALNGIRVISMGWVVLGHLSIHSLNVQNNIFYYGLIGKNILFQPIANSTLSVDTFFVLSGLLVMYTGLKAVDKLENPYSAKFWVMFYVHRLIRLWPTLLLTLLFVVGLYPVLSGFFYSPLFQVDTDTSIVEQCSGVNWLKVVFFVNNLEDQTQNKPCMTWTWYLSDDMQFYLITPIFLLLTRKSRLVGSAAISLCVLISTIIIISFSAANDITAQGNPLTLSTSTRFSQSGNAKWVGYIYQWPISRFQTYGIGLLCGLVLYERESITRSLGERSLNRRISIVNFCWLTAFFIACLSVYGCYPSVNGSPMSTGAAAMYNATYRILWGSAIAIMIILCCWGYGGILNDAFSGNFWIPWARITYTTYIIHVVLIWCYLDSVEQTIRWTVPYLAVIFSGTVMCCYCVALVVSCIIEAPFIQLEKILFGR